MLHNTGSLKAVTADGDANVTADSGLVVVSTGNAASLSQLI